MKRVNTFGTFLETIKPEAQSQPPSSAQSSGLRSADQGSPPRTNAMLALRILDTLSPAPMDVANLMKQTADDPFEFAKVLQDLEKLNAVVVDRQTNDRIARLGPAAADVRPLFSAS
jgi:hypothetical protein